LRILEGFVTKYNNIPFPTFKAVSELGSHHLQRLRDYDYLTDDEELTMDAWSEWVTGDLGWQPKYFDDQYVYGTPMCRHVRVPLLTDDFKRSEAWKNEINKITKIFDILEAVHESGTEKKTTTYYTRLCSALDINLYSISTEEMKSMSAQDAQCGICQQPLVPYKEYTESCMKRLPTYENLDDLLPNWKIFEDADGTAEEIFRKAMEGTMFNLPDGMESSMREFANTLYQACVRLNKLREHIPDTCTYPVKTECGHIFGKCCLFPWIDANRIDTTCPYCRAGLSARYQPSHTVFDEELSEDEEYTDEDYTDDDIIGFLGSSRREDSWWDRDGREQPSGLAPPRQTNTMAPPPTEVPGNNAMAQTIRGMQRTMPEWETRSSTNTPTLPVAPNFLTLTDEESGDAASETGSIDSAVTTGPMSAENTSTLRPSSPDTTQDGDGEAAPISFDDLVRPSLPTTTARNIRTIATNFLANLLLAPCHEGSELPNAGPSTMAQPQTPTPAAEPSTSAQAQDQQTSSTSTPEAPTLEEFLVEDEHSILTFESEEENEAAVQVPFIDLQTAIRGARAEERRRIEEEGQAIPARSGATPEERRIEFELFQQEIHAAHERRMEAMESMLAESDSEEDADGDW
jgi:hypothetical protein